MLFFSRTHGFRTAFSLRPFSVAAPMRLKWISFDILQRIWIIFFIITALADIKTDCFMFLKNDTSLALQPQKQDLKEYFLQSSSSQMIGEMERIAEHNQLLFQLLKASAVGSSVPSSSFKTFSKRINEVTDRLVNPQNSLHDFNQKRDFQYEESFKACPSIRRNDALEYAYLEGSLTKVKVEQRAFSQRFPLVLCNNVQVYGRRSNCPNCCVGIDHRSYHSQCRTENITYPAAVRMPDRSSPTRWSSQIRTKMITFPGSCVCSLSTV